MVNTYLQNGIAANTVSIDGTDILAVTYDGLLFKSGADYIYAHYGYGSKWTKQNTVKMIKTDSGFRANIPIQKTGPINIVFKDSAENWDNNNGSYYSFSLRSK